MIHFSGSKDKNILDKEAISSLFEEISCDEIDEEEMNPKLSLLVWKKIFSNRKKI